MIQKIRDSIAAEEFDYTILLDRLSAYKNPRVKIRDLLKKKDIIRVKKGLYVFGPRWSRGPIVKETLANLIYGPSYISLEYALSFHGLIPERVEEVTSITDKRNKRFDTPVGVFSYRYQPMAVFCHGMVSHPLDALHRILIASPEKALCDTLFYLPGPPAGRKIEIEQLLFNDLRIDPKALRKTMKRRALCEIAGLFGNRLSTFRLWAGRYVR